MELIREDDAAIRVALADAHFPSLAGAIAHLTGETGILIDGRPVYDFFGDGQGGFAPARKAQIAEAAVGVLRTLRDRGADAFATASHTPIHEIMNFVAGAEVPDRYVPFLLEQLGVKSAEPMSVATDIPETRKRAFHVLIVGAGMSGILAAIHLTKAGIPFTIVDKNADVGGTWFENAYPGCRVDNPNHMYSYSFAPNHDWPHHYSTQDALLAYFRGVADKFGVRARVRFNTEVLECVYDENRHMWHSRAREVDGHEILIESNAVITAVGQLNRPKLPDIKGVGSFEGASFHSAQWDHSVDLKGKRVLVIGTGASAFQFVPAIVADVGEMFVFQRTPPWLAATPDYYNEVPQGQKWLLKHMPWYAQWYRFWLFWMLTDGLIPYVSVDPEWHGAPGTVSAGNAQLRELLTQYVRDRRVVMQNCSAR